MKNYLLNTRRTLLASALLMTSLSALAASQNNQPNANYTGWSWSGHVDHITFDKQAAATQGRLILARGLAHVHVSWLNTVGNVRVMDLRTFCIWGIYPCAPYLTSAFAPVTPNREPTTDRTAMMNRKPRTEGFAPKPEPCHKT